jgi:hypothetical protein
LNIRANVYVAAHEAPLRRAGIDVDQCDRRRF